jgi:hypothetical protein
MNETTQKRIIEGEDSAQAARNSNEGAGETARPGQVEGEDSQVARSQGGVEGEGSYTAAREYGRAARAFARSGRVEEAAEEAATALDREPETHREAEQQGKARIQEEDPALARAESGDSAGVHVKHERQGWVVEAPGNIPFPTFDNIDDALRRAHEIASMQHVPLFVHGPDGELIDTFEA